MKHLGNICDINGAKIEPVDVITAGSPCQDLSIAGKRDGLKGKRSGLFMEFIRIVKEMRAATNGAYPTIIIWENVPGAFSSNKGEDFRCVLEEICKIKDSDAIIPRPPKGKWADAGEILGDGYSVAWRVLDAQFWGVPQRRNRIALVGHLGGQRAGEILFIEKGLLGNPAESGAAGERTAVDSKAGVRAASGFNGRAGAESGSIAYCEEASPTLKSEQETHVLCSGFNGHKSITGSIQYEEETAPTLESNMPSNVMCYNPHDAQSARIYSQDGVWHSLNANSNGGQSRDAVLCYACRTDQTGSNGLGVCEDVAHTLDGSNGQALVFENHAQDSRVTGPLDVSPTYSQKRGTGGNNVPIVCEPLTFSFQRSDEYKQSDQASTLAARDYKSATDLIIENCIARRLTPLECERLQGFPDKWADIPDYIDQKGKKKKVSDSARYRALGNSIALPPWYFVLSQLPDAKTLGSLFDGIGGFPLIWERLHGKGSARWASEIEDFPIAVTKYHFEEECI